jgi:hypothetical protein
VVGSGQGFRPPADRHPALLDACVHHREPVTEHLEATLFLESLGAGGIATEPPLTLSYTNRQSSLDLGDSYPEALTLGY